MKIFSLAMTLTMFVSPAATVLAAEVSYRCSGGTALTARFSPPGAEAGQVVMTFGGGRTVTLAQQLSADGGRYVGGDIEFWIKGRNATLRRGRDSETCSTD